MPANTSPFPGKNIRITQGDTAIALDIMREAAAWLNKTGKPLWRLEDITEQKILVGITKKNVTVGWIGDETAAAMILQWRDPFFWPQAGDDSGFIHKLSVRRRFAGTDISRRMVEWARQEAQRRGKKYLRLDCAANRPKLCSIYESLGFRQVDRRMVGTFDEAFYELRLAE
jgi:GNAT superfamily N-acetyltransferase